MTKNHFVPQFYLKGFIDPASKDLHNPYLWVVDLQDRIVMKKGPENVARIVGFYDWDELGDIAPSIEDIYSKIESRAAPVVARIRNNDFHMTMGDRYNLSIFIGFQISRTPFARSLVIDRIKNSGQEKLHEIVRNEVEFREKLDNYLKSKNGESENF